MPQAPKSALDGVMSLMKKKASMSTVVKTKLDWDGYVIQCFYVVLSIFVTDFVVSLSSSRVNMNAMKLDRDGYVENLVFFFNVSLIVTAVRCESESS